MRCMSYIMRYMSRFITSLTTRAVVYCITRFIITRSPRVESARRPLTRSRAHTADGVRRALELARALPLGGRGDVHAPREWRAHVRAEQLRRVAAVQIGHDALGEQHRDVELVLTQSFGHGARSAVVGGPVDLHAVLLESSGRDRLRPKHRRTGQTSGEVDCRRALVAVVVVWGIIRSRAATHCVPRRVEVLRNASHSKPLQAPARRRLQEGDACSPHLAHVAIGSEKRRGP